MGEKYSGLKKYSHKNDNTGSMKENRKVQSFLKMNKKLIAYSQMYTLVKIKLMD